MKIIIEISTLTVVVMLVSLPVVGQTVVGHQAEETSTEVNGVEFEIVVGEREWIIPEREVPTEVAGLGYIFTPAPDPGAFSPRWSPENEAHTTSQPDLIPHGVEAIRPTPETAFQVQIGLRVTNHSPEAVRLNPFILGGQSLKLKFSDTKGEILALDGQINTRDVITSRDLHRFICRSLLPGSSVEIPFYFILYRHEGSVRFGASDNYLTYLEGIEPGAYKLQFTYTSFAEHLCYDPNSLNAYGITLPRIGVIEGLWQGEVVTPAVEIQVLE